MSLPTSLTETSRVSHSQAVNERFYYTCFPLITLVKQRYKSSYIILQLCAREIVYDCHFGIAKGSVTICFQKGLQDLIWLRKTNPQCGGQEQNCLVLPGYFI